MKNNFSQPYSAASRAATEQMAEALRRGETYASIGRRYGISKVAVFHRINPEKHRLQDQRRRMQKQQREACHVS